MRAGLEDGREGCEDARDEREGGEELGGGEGPCV